MSEQADARRARVSQLGERAFLLETNADPNVVDQRRIWSLSRTMLERSEIAETSIGVGNLLVIFSRPPPDAARTMHQLQEAWRDAGSLRLRGRKVEIAVRYGGPFRDDLRCVAEQCGLSPAEVVAIHAQRTYQVFAVGSSPGYAYLFGVDERIHVPRLATPRLSAPRGSVVIAGAQTGVTVVDGPIGWNILGQADANLFALDRKTPNLLKAGDEVRFSILSMDT